MITLPPLLKKFASLKGSSEKLAPSRWFTSAKVASGITLPAADTVTGQSLLTSND